MKRIPNTRKLVFTALLSALMAMSAYLQIPFVPVPITMQTFVCVLAGILLGKKYGTLSQAIYVAVGLAGIPVFSGGGGLAYVLRPSFGFLLGFIVCAFVVGAFSERVKINSWKASLPAALIGMAVIDIFGYAYMYLILTNVSGMGADAAVSTVTASALTFLPGDLLKSALVAVLVPILIRRAAILEKPAQY